MSLINQMLNDLDQRQAAGSTMNDSNDNSAPYISVPFTAEKKQSKTAYIKTSLFILVFISLFITSYYSYLIYTQQSNSVATSALVNHKPGHKKSAHAAPVQLQRKHVKIIKAPLQTTPVTSKPKPIQNVMPSTAVIENTDVAEAVSENRIEAVVDEENFNTDIQSVKKHQLQLTPQQQAEVAYTSGYNLLQKNKIYSAESKLLLALEHNINHIKAREMLVGLYLKIGRKVEARDLLMKGIVLLPSYKNFTKLYARLLIDNNEIDKAVTILLQQKPALTSDPNYYAILAASYQRQKNHNAAAKTYVELLKLKPREGIWWVGMAISLEALNKKQDALNAYEKARQTGTLNTRISNYSAQRLKQLNLHSNTSDQ